MSSRLHVLIVGALALLAVVACRSAEPTPTPVPTPTPTPVPTPSPTPVSLVSPGGDPVDVPYLIEEVNWPLGNTRVDAVLTIPQGSGPFPAVLFVAGSGPTDRNWNSPLLPGVNGSAELLAHLLTRRGYVTLRYDKRVAGPNALANVQLMVGQISLQSHLDEVAGGVALLADRPEVSAERIFALANSEGTLHVMNYQRGQPEISFAGLILAAPPGRPMGILMRSQIAAQLDGVVIDPEGTLRLYDEALARFTAGEPVNPSPELPEGIRQLLSSLEAPINLPFTREIMTVDPAVWLADMEAPVLVIIGKKDIQVDWQVDGGLLQAATADQANVTFVFPEDADHVLKYEAKPADQLSAADAINYNQSDRLLDPPTVDLILTWLADR